LPWLGSSTKEYSPEEDRIYNESIAKIREGMKNGLTFGEACQVIDVTDEELKEFILDDALKIMIAELHYGKAMNLEEVARILIYRWARSAWRASRCSKMQACGG